MQGKVVLITGGAKRVGAAICRRLHERGANLMIHYRSSESEARALADELNAHRPGSASPIQADLLDTPSLPGLVSRTIERFGRLDVLVNNASSFFPTTLGEIDEKAWEDLIGTNLKAPLFLSQAAAKEIRRHHGCIVNIVDIHAERPLENYLVYTTAKGGLVALTRSLAREIGPEARANAVAPGAILWPEDDTWSNVLERQQIINQTLLKRVGEPDDIAKTVTFLAADAPYITGEVIAVDGGRSINL